MHYIFVLVDINAILNGYIAGKKTGLYFKVINYIH